MKTCSVDGCDELGAFRTRTRPTWCLEHLHELYRSSGLLLLEEFTKPSEHLLTRCLHCGFEGHYRFEYVLDQLSQGVRVCRACFWKEWAKESRTWGAEPVSVPEIKTLAEASGYTYLGQLTDPSLPDDPHRTRCNRCGRIEAQRAGDIGWGCPCSRNTKTATAGAKKTPGNNLLKNSDNKATTWWDHDRNPEALWKTAKLRGRKRAWWICDEGHSFEARMLDVTSFFSPCPECREKTRAEWKARHAAYDGLTIADVPELLAAWEEDIPPESVLVSDNPGDSGYRFRCPNGHRNTRLPLSWLLGGCAACKAAITKQKLRDAAEEDPNFTRLTPEISSQWHPTKNKPLKLAQMAPESRRTVWWLDPTCGHEFQATPRERDKYQRLRCPQCNTILDSLAYHYPDIAEEWSHENALTPWHVRPNATNFIEAPWWVCSTDSSHTWQATPGSRVNGSTCPMCQIVGKSRIELLYAEAARQEWGNAQSGQRIHSPMFADHSSWSVDILVTLEDNRSLVIEYDGSYWHRDKEETDRIKTCELLQAGYVVCRVRESPLASLDIDEPGYIELTVYPGAQEPLRDIAKLAALVLTA